MCMGTVLSSFVGGVVYAVESPTDGAVELARGWVGAGHHLSGYVFPNVVGGVLRSESRELFRQYVERTDESPLRAWAQTLAELADAP